jgi:hypothetical protein
MSTTTSAESQSKKVLYPVQKNAKIEKKMFAKNFKPEQISKQANLPSKVDPRTTGATTPVRDQGQYGLCWAYSGTDVLSLNKQKALGGAFTIYSPSYFDHLTAMNGFSTPNPYAGLGERVLGEGGWNQTIFYDAFTNYKPATEANFPTDVNGVSNGDYVEKVWNWEDFTKVPTDNSFTVNHVLMPSGGNTWAAVAAHINQVKIQVYLYGAVGCTSNGDAYQPNVTYDKSTDFYNEKTNSVYVPMNAPETIKFSFGSKNYTAPTYQSNHALTIVGYDDNYSKDNFEKAYQPQNNGAFLVKNSWGSDVYDGGYFWESYEDYFAMVDAQNVSASISPNTVQPDITYTNATAPAFTMWGVHENGDDPFANNQAFVSSTFTTNATKKQFLKEVALQNIADNSAYEVYLLPGKVDTTHTTLTGVLKNAKRIAKGTSSVAGIHKLAVNNTKLQPNTTYTLVEVEKCPEDTGANANFEITYDDRDTAGDKSILGYIQADGSMKYYDLSKDGLQDYVSAYVTVK